MRLSTRSIPNVLPGVRGTLRAERPTRGLLGRLRPGDIAVIDHVDLDRATAKALVDAGVVAVINAQPMLSGRYPNQGPLLLAEAGIPMVDSVGEFGYGCLADGRMARVDEGKIYDGELRLTEGRELDIDGVRSAMDDARGGMLAQLETFTHNSTELLRREQEVLLHGVGVPSLRTNLTGKPVVVIASADAVELRRMRSFAKEQHPVVVAVGTAADTVRGLGWSVDVIVIGTVDDMPSAKVLRGAKDVVIAAGAVSATAVEDAISRMGVAPHWLESTISPEDAALLVVHVADPSLIVGVGMTATLTDFLEKQRPGLASTFLSRLAVGPTLVDAAAVPTLYSGRTKGWHLLLALLICVAAVLAALATTALGQQWAHELWHHLVNDYDALRARMQGRHA
jgi:uncharacterized membrane-anchored protein